MTLQKKLTTSNQTGKPQPAPENRQNEQLRQHVLDALRASMKQHHILYTELAK